MNAEAPSRLYAAFEFWTLAFFVFSNGDPTHLTWWAVVLLVAYDGVIALGPSMNVPRPWRLRAWTAGFSLSVLVQLVVGLMSLIRCSMLRDALGEVGTWTYFLGNFALHYWPTLRYLAASPRAADAKELRRRKPTSSGVQGSALTFDCARVLAAYATIQAPAKVYGCGQIPAWVPMPAGVVAALACEWFVRRVVSPRIF